MIMYIDIARILPHPNNPRKDLGDLTELANSIKANGILQNLTIVPVNNEVYHKKINSKKAYPGDYTAIIGHRRLAAAKLAGLTKVPCIIAADMDEKKQVATMLLENIQRSDLTVYEQAQGFQMMLDFGENINSISEKTGFSETTIRKRVKLLDLDKDKFKESIARGATLQDYAELNSIRNVELKNEVLETIGTANFKYKLKQAIDQEKQTDKVAAFVAELEKFATRVESADGLRQVEYFMHSSKLKVEKPIDSDNVKYYFLVSSYSTKLLREVTAEDIKADQEEKEEKQELLENRARLEEISNRALQLRSDFVKDFKSTKKCSGDIMAFAIQTMLQKGFMGSFDNKNFLKMLDIEPEKSDSNEENEKLTFEAVSRAIAFLPERALLIAAYCNYGDSPGRCFDWDCKFIKDKKIISLYSFLKKLGYEMSDEERAFCEGTHEAFVCDYNLPEAA